MLNLCLLNLIPAPQPGQRSTHTHPVSVVSRVQLMNVTLDPHEEAVCDGVPELCPFYSQ